MAVRVFIKRKFTTFWVFGILTVILSLLITAQSCKKNTTTNTYLNHSDQVKYVGKAACIGCHEDKWITFQHTGMGQSFHYATREKSSAHFGLDHQVLDTSTGLWYYPFWRNDSLVIREYKLNEQGDTLHQLEVTIDYIVGSGQHTNSHILKRGNYLYQAPITFYVQQTKWDLAPGFENGNNSRFSRVLSTECLSCHNAMPKMLQESDFQFKEVATGIDCERCHGPGELHVKKHQDGETDEETDYTIVNPSKLRWERQVDVCQRCHLQGLNVLKEGKKFTDFIPGMELKDVFEIYLPHFEGGESRFDMANHAQRFQNSECFIQGNQKNLSFTCISCHNPHISVKQTGKGVYNAACGNCHKSKDACSLEMVERLKVKDNCVQCHMPVTSSEDIPHVTVHDHWIRIPSKPEDRNKVQNLIGLYAVNNPNPDSYTKTKAYLEYWEKFDKNPFYLQRAKELLDQHNHPRLLLKYYYLVESYQDAVQLKLDTETLTAWELFMLSQSHSKLGQERKALFYSRLAIDKKADQPSILKEHAKQLLSNSKLQEAEQFGKQLLVQLPEDGEVMSHLAKTLILRNRLMEAEPYLSEALRLEPMNVEVLETMVNWLYRQNKLKEAKEYLNKIKQLSPTYYKELEKDLSNIGYP
jgi:tetratricopeptide (TPR) repeat protein